jgi:hypothetical protein
VGYGLAETLDVRVMFSFDHNAGGLLGPGILEDDAGIFAEGGLGFGWNAGEFTESFEGAWTLKWVGRVG